MLARSLVALPLLLSAGCTSHEGEPKPQPKPEGQVDPEPEPEPEPEPPKVVATARIASVQMIEDCPQHDPPPPAQPASLVPSAQAPMGGQLLEDSSVAAGARARPMDGAAGDSALGWGPSMCTQSSMQIVFSGQGEEPGRVRIQRIRMLKPEGSVPLATLDARLPSLWNSGAYTPWDEVVPAGAEVQASYRLSVPEWSLLEKALGGSSYGPMFVLEVELEIDGQRQTIRSPEFPREMPHVVVT